MKLKSVFVCIALLAGGLGGSTPSAASADVLTVTEAPILESAGYFGEDGFSIAVANFDNGCRYTWSVSQGVVSVAVQPNTDGQTRLLLTVSNIPAGDSATLTVTANRDSYAPATTTVTGFAKQAGFSPILGRSIRSDASYMTPIYNFDSAFTWSFRAIDAVRNIHIDVINCHPSNAETVPCVIVSDLIEDETVSVEATISRSGYASSTFNITGTSLARGEDIRLGNYVQTADGFTIQNLNPDSRFAWSISVNRGSISFGPNNTLVVTGLTPGEEARVQILSRNVNTYMNGRDFVGKALETGSSSTPTPVPPPAPTTNLDPAPTPAPTVPAPAPTVPAPAPTADASATPEPAVVSTPDLAKGPSPADASTAPVVKTWASQIKDLTIPQLRALKPSVIGALAPKVLASLPVNKLKALTKAQMRAILHIQWLKLSPEQRRALRW
jgi:hypothetical protein